MRQATLKAREAWDTTPSGTHLARLRASVVFPWSQVLLRLAQHVMLYQKQVICCILATLPMVLMPISQMRRPGLIDEQVAELKKERPAFCSFSSWAPVSFLRLPGLPSSGSKPSADRMLLVTVALRAPARCPGAGLWACSTRLLPLMCPLLMAFTSFPAKHSKPGVPQERGNILWTDWSGSVAWGNDGRELFCVFVFKQVPSSSCEHYMNKQQLA